MNAPSQPARRGAILLEVMVALALLVGMAGVLFSGMASAFSAVEDLRLDAQAADLAVTLMSEVELGLLPAENAGPAGYAEADLADWSWQVAVEIPDDQPYGIGRMHQVQVIVVHQPSGVVHRLATLTPADDQTEARP